MPGVNRMYSRLIKLQGEKSSMQKQQTSATMRSDCPQKASTHSKKKERKRKQNAITEQTVSVDVSNEIEGKCRPITAILTQAYEQCVPN